MLLIDMEWPLFSNHIDLYTERCEKMKDMVETYLISLAAGLTLELIPEIADLIELIINILF